MISMEDYMSDLNTIGGIHYDMMRRCYNEKSVAFKDYGAKGIIVCPEWHEREQFRQWAIVNGYVKGLRLERRDSSGDYEPDNCYFGDSMKRKSGVAQRAKTIKQHRKSMKKFAGIEGQYSKTRLYNIFKLMHVRCENVLDPHYEKYGGRGINVCKEWSGEDGFFYFYKWAMENGYNEKLSIDRIDNDKGYSPDNCRWATNKVQIDNRRTSKLYEYNGDMMNLKDIAKMTGTQYGMLYSRINKKGMTVYQALEDIVGK